MAAASGAPPQSLPAVVNFIAAVLGAVHLNHTVWVPAATGSPSCLVAPSILLTTVPAAPFNTRAWPRLSFGGGEPDAAAGWPPRISAAMTRIRMKPKTTNGE